MRKTWVSSKIGEHAAVELARLLERRAERLLDHHPHLGVARRWASCRAAQRLDDHREERPARSTGRRRGSAARRRAARSRRAPAPGRRRRRRRRTRPARSWRLPAASSARPRRACGARSGGSPPRTRRGTPRAVFSFARDANQVEALGQRALVGEVVERGQQFALGQIAGGAEDDQRGGGDRQALQVRP